MERSQQRKKPAMREAQCLVPAVAVSHPSRSQDMQRGQGTKTHPVYLFSPFNYPVTWLNCGLDELILNCL